jgi:hypothetical protein
MSYNRWMYGYSNPINYTDPSGFDPSVTVGNTTFSCSVYEAICHWYGAIPDYDDIDYVNSNKSQIIALSKGQIDPTSMASAIAVQSQWMKSSDSIDMLIAILWCKWPWMKYEQIKEVITHTGLGPGSFAYGSEDMDGGDPYILEDVVEGMENRITSRIKDKFLNNAHLRDKVILYGMAQNAGISSGDIGKDYFQEIEDDKGKTSYIFYWSGFFANQDPLSTDSSNLVEQARVNINNNRAGVYINYNTRFQLKLYIQDMKDLIQKGWPYPSDGKETLNSVDIENIYRLAETGSF